MKFVDTNIFIRFLTGDHPAQSPKARAFIRRLGAGQERATTSEVIIAEVVYVLSSQTLYSLTPAAIEARLRPLLLLRGLKLPHQRRLLRALSLYALGTVDFEDALTVALCEEENLAAIVSFDKHFDRVPSVVREEPA